MPMDPRASRPGPLRQRIAGTARRRVIARPALGRVVAMLGVGSVAGVAIAVTVASSPATVLQHAAAASGSTRPAMVIAPTAAIKHVVIIYQENHSFDNTLGVLCQQLGRCDGSSTGQIHAASGSTTTYRLGKAADKVPAAAHDPASQTVAVDGGAMDGFDQNAGCRAAQKYACLTQYDPAQIPNLAQLATNYVISDRTFEPTASASWGAHLEIASSTLSGFSGDNPGGQVSPSGQGWGCDTRLTASWQASPGAPFQQVPSCIPNPDGTGAFEPTPVPWTPTIMDRLDAARLSWKLYTPQPGNRGYGWAICPSFADCLGTSQDRKDVKNSLFVKDAAAGHLPAWSVVTPNSADSQHNGNSMKRGDNWIGDAVRAVMKGPDWSSTAIFITYDDCGCFYDHVPPPSGLGIRVPMVIVSPYARAQYTDSATATYDSLLAFTEHVFGLPALTDADGDAYDYADSFTLPTVSPSPAPTDTSTSMDPPSSSTSDSPSSSPSTDPPSSVSTDPPTTSSTDPPPSDPPSSTTTDMPTDTPTDPSTSPSLDPSTDPPPSETPGVAPARVFGAAYPVSHRPVRLVDTPLTAAEARAVAGAPPDVDDPY